jgi:hypothetical protein
MNFIDILQMVARRRIQRETRTALSGELNSTTCRRPETECASGGEVVSLGIADDGTDLVSRIDALCSHGLILGATGAGKTCAAYVLIEAMVKTWKERE